MNPIEGVHALNQIWTPHQGQLGPGLALFGYGFKHIYIQAGRNWGKTDFVNYCAVRWAIEHPGTETYIFEPFANQAREILWESRRLEKMIPPNWLAGTNNTDMRCRLTNGSFVKLDGADNGDSRRGIKPGGLIVYDELKDIKPSFLNGMEPNRAAHGVPALFTGTPPEFHNHYVEMMEFAKTDPESRWFHAPSKQNPHLKMNFLERERRRLLAAGAEDEWLREYEAVFVKGGARAIFPQAARYSYPNLDTLLPNDLNHWWLIVSADPGSTSVFAVGFYLFNPYQKRLVAVDEIYETKMEEMTTRKIAKRINEKLNNWREKRPSGKFNYKVGEVRFVYDEAAAWFRNELNEITEIDNDDVEHWWWSPTAKAENGKEEGIGFIRDLFTQSRLDIASNCVKLRWELENYAKDDKGKIPKINDHMIDNLRYAIVEAGLDLKDKDYPKPPDPDTQRRAYRIEEEMNFGMTRIGSL